MKKIMCYLFPEKSNWIDVGMFNSEGYFYIIQMRYNIKNNKKQFRKAKIGFVNDRNAEMEINKNSFNKN